MDTTGLTRSQIAAKQLAHNSIQGQDNDQLLAEIYRQIEDAESKLEAFVDAKLDVDMPKVRIEGLDIDLDFKTILLIFLPRVKERLDRALRSENRPVRLTLEETMKKIAEIYGLER